MNEITVLTTPTRSGMIQSKNSDNKTLEDNDGTDWDETIQAFEAINIAIIAFTTFVLLCMIAYGTKTKRWTKGARGSSLNNGLVFTTSVIVITLTLPKLIAVEVMYNIQRMKNGTASCELSGDLRKAAYTVSLYGTYFFLCLRQRLIYTHPYVKKKVGKCMDALSRLIFLILTAVAIGLLCFLIIPKSFGSSSSQYCIESREYRTSVVLAGVFVSTQAVMLGLCIYPAFRVRLNPNSETEVTVYGKDYETNNNQDSTSLAHCCRFLSEVATSPVEMTIKRTLLASTLIVVSDIIAATVEAVAIPKDAPAVVRYTVIDIGSFADIFFIVATFGFAGKVFTLFVPKCRKLEAGGNVPGEESSVTSADAEKVGKDFCPWL